MASPSGGNFKRLVSGVIEPTVPQGQSPVVDRWNRALVEWIKHLFGLFTQANLQGFTLPPIPDPEKDYILAYDHTDHLIKWIETTEVCPLVIP